MSRRVAGIVAACAVLAYSQFAAAQESGIVKADGNVTADAGAPGLSLTAAVASAAVVTALDDAQTAPPPRVATEYSDAYRLRAKIHKVSSFATLPLFGTEAVLGQSLYSNPTSPKKDAHLAVAAGIGALFAVNTVTGVWNLVEGRKDPNKRGLRLFHGILMLSADAGFLATAALGPSSEHGDVEGSRSAHRAVAFTSISMASAGYLIMLFNH
jgi:hypothetical protein